MSVHSDKISLSLIWLFTTLTGLIEQYIFKPAGGVWFLFAIYHIGLFLELYWLHKQHKLNWQLTRKKIKTVTGSLFGAVLLLFVASGVARYTPIAFFWMPDLLMTLLFTAILLTIVRFSSKLEILSPQIAVFLEKKINQSTQKLNENEPVSNPEIDSVDQKSLEPDNSTSEVSH
ncbi:hypothetical protein [Xanthocytophaga flava]|uniref:hypothetical protein n=1 Tax=Xanthocytophaga flava TaxID=3048013 RepID=UPI0028D2CFA7|nr:hypothetical protein [Xanthocytophaga flavus]